ncbi:hypothetical protein [Formosa haliotis]|uniref:hypothetical protein n=1 Tax=Formosa haliotis TaxID=1555194 RepID=UPI0008268AC5|nr:hypothetical protein [Formosa haliotis]
MKNLIIFLSIILSFNSCSQNDEIIKKSNSIVGTWKLIETYESNGGNNPQWTTISDGYTYIFTKNGKFTSNRFSECTDGSYSITGINLTLDYSCNNFDTGIETPAGTFIEEYSFEGENIILTPTYLTCIEGCKFKFQKIE